MKALIYEIRALIALLLLNWAFDIMPDDKKLSMAGLHVATGQYLRKVLINGTY